MKEINQDFAMKMLEKKLDKTREQIQREAALNDKSWPMGLDELDSSLHSQEALARATVDYFGSNRPKTITDQHIRDIYESAFGMKLSRLIDSDVERYQKDIKLIFEIYDE